MAKQTMTNTTTQQFECAGLLAGKKFVVAGLGVSGLSSVKFLSQFSKEMCVMDSRTTPPHVDELRSSYPDVELISGKFDQEKLNDADYVIAGPGVPLKTAELQNAINSGVTVIGDVELFARCVKGKIIAITGSNGKTTVTSLVAEMARMSGVNYRVGGNIGTPVLDLLDDNANTEFYILELSSFQLETTQSLNAFASVILNLSEDHMDRYDSFNEYAEAKNRIYTGSEYTVINNDEFAFDKDNMAYSYSLEQPRNETTFGLIVEGDTTWFARGEQKLLPVTEAKLKGRHNYSNILAALALGSVMELPMTAMLEAIRHFTGLAHRTQWVAEQNGVEWFNDSKATNVGATLAALNGFDGKNNILLLLGGQSKGQDFTFLNETLKQKARQVYLFGEDADVIAKELDSMIPVQRMDDLQQAIVAANDLATTGDIVLLSPACASFDMFTGFEQRGNEFMRIAQEVLS